MDFGAIGGYIPIIIVAVALILLQVYLTRRRKPEVTHRSIVQNLLLEVKLNLAQIENFHLLKKPKKFMYTSWYMTKNKLDFLEQPLQTALSDTYQMIEDYNQQIGAARKYKSESYMVNINLDKLIEPMERSRDGLEDWLQETTGSREPQLEYPSLLDYFIGRRR